MFFVVNGLKNSLVNIQGTLLGFRVVLSNLINKILCTICLLDIMFNQTQEREGGSKCQTKNQKLISQTDPKPVRRFKFACFLLSNDISDEIDQCGP